MKQRLKAWLTKHIILVICIILLIAVLLPLILLPWPIALLINAIELFIFWVRDSIRKGTIHWK